MLTTRNNRGFTLVELLVAITIGAVVLATIYASFSFGIRTRNHVRHNARELEQSRAFFDQMARDLRSVVSFQPESLTGNNRSLRFKAFLPADLATAAAIAQDNASYATIENLSPVVYVRYYTPEEGDRTKVFREVSNLVGAVIETRTYDLGFERIRFAFGYGVDAGEGWQELWDNDGRFPAAVKLDITFGKGADEDGARTLTKIIAIPAVKRIEEIKPGDDA